MTVPARPVCPTCGEPVEPGAPARVLIGTAVWMSDARTHDPLDCPVEWPLKCEKCGAAIAISVKGVRFETSTRMDRRR